MFTYHSFGKTLITLCLLATSTPLLQAETLREELAQLEAMRNGLQTPLGLVDQKGKSLLAQYTSQTDRAEIYYLLAHVHAQSGLTHPEKIFEYSRKALDLPVTNPQRLILYIYSGDAASVQKGNSKPDAARKAMEFYMAGLSEVAKLNLPEKPSELLPVNKYDVSGSPEELQKVKKIHQAELEQRQKAEATNKLIQYREILIDQIVSQYPSSSYSLTQFKDILNAKIQNKTLIDSITSRIKRTSPK
jgi:hypothetical protein